MLRICLAGVTGWTGQPLARAILASDDLVLVSAVSRRAAGQRLSTVVGGAESDLIVSPDVNTALSGAAADVLVDFTSPSVVKSNVEAALSRRLHVVIGTSGLTDEAYEQIDEWARRHGTGVIAGGNFAISAVLLRRFAEEAIRYLPDVEIVDYAYSKKPDAPSGMTRELAHRLARLRPESSAPPIHSIRLPGYVIGAEALFGRHGERLSIKYDAGESADPYVEGTLLAARQVLDVVGLRRGLDLPDRGSHHRLTVFGSVPSVAPKIE
jgi:4-hydroxy-tetrahydrodipicolinate reductase